MKHFPFILVLGAALAVSTTSCFTPRGQLADRDLEGALEQAPQIAYDPLVSTIGFGTAPVVTPGEKEAYDLARKYLVALGIDVEFKTSVEDVLNVYRRELNKVPPEFFEEFKAKLDVSNATDQAIRAVMKLHPQDELREIVAFFESPSGKAYLARRPDLTQDMARLGVEFARQVNDRLVLELKRRNFMY